MRDKRLGRTLAIGIAALAVFNTVSSLSMPIADRRPSLGMTLAVAVALVAHSTVYWFSDRLRERLTVAGYLAIQATLVFLVGLTGTIIPVVLTLYVALTVEAIVVAESQWGTMAITTGAIVLLGASAAFAWGVYRAATVGLLLAVVGVLAHAVAALVRRDAPDPQSAPARPGAEEAANIRQVPAPAEVDFDRRDLARLTARARSPSVAHERRAHDRDRRTTRHCRANREGSPREHLPKARGRLAHGGGRDGVAEGLLDRQRRVGRSSAGEQD